MSYRVVVRHVRYWRGVVHRWSTVYQYINTPTKPLDTAALRSVMVNDGAICYQKLTTDGGIYGGAIYSQASGGTPVVEIQDYDPDTPAAWAGITGTAWQSYTAITEPVAETALLIEWPAGLSKTGKPVTLRKWYHSVPASAAPAGGADVSSANVTSLTTAATTIQSCLASYGLSLGSSTGRLAGTPRVLSHYGNHQMPRGRRRKVITLQGPNGKISLGDVTTIIGAAGE